jgi:hypothetical protein
MEGLPLPHPQAQVKPHPWEVRLNRITSLKQQERLALAIATPFYFFCGSSDQTLHAPLAFHFRVCDDDDDDDDAEEGDDCL